jgi:hypothetical protein
MLYTAAALIVATGLAHSYLGERYILMRLFKREDLPKLFGSAEFTIGTLRFAWHLTTVAWWGLAYLVFLAAGPALSPRSVLQAVAVVSLVSAAFPIYFTRGRHLSWVVFLAVSALLYVCAERLPT